MTSIFALAGHWRPFWTRRGCRLTFNATAGAQTNPMAGQSLAQRGDQSGSQQELPRHVKGRIFNTAAQSLSSDRAAQPSSPGHLPEADCLRSVHRGTLLERRNFLRVGEFRDALNN